MPNDTPQQSDRDLALWMLERMRDSEAFLTVLRKARRAGKRHVLDHDEDIAPRKADVAKLYQSDEEEPSELPEALSGLMSGVIERDVLSSHEELLEKALRAYIDSHPRGSEGLPGGWQTTLEAARDEIEGKTSGAFEPGFVGRLAEQARAEQALEAERAGRDR